ncbi:MAG: ribonuclease III [Candidatus Bipolaricaulota bacterium]|nr:ribonuclease III [Candidatus Bipolaricaulota bacterium]
MTKDLNALSKKIDVDVPAEELKRAFYHTSFVNESDKNLRSYERLEFLGDAVVELAIREYLFEEFPGENEGELSKIKAVAVSKPVLSDRAADLHLGEYLYLGKGEKESGGRNKDSILCDVFESLVGVIFLNKGYREAAKFVVNMLRDEVDNLLDQQSVLSYKSALQIEAQKQYEKRPTYTVLEETGKAHNRRFKVEASLNQHRGIGRGRSKKEAEEAAAKQVYLQIKRG